MQPSREDSEKSNQITKISLTTMMISSKSERTISMDATRLFSTMTKMNSTKMTTMELSSKERLILTNILIKFTERGKMEISDLIKPKTKTKSKIKPKIKTKHKKKMIRLKILKMLTAFKKKRK